MESKLSAPIAAVASSEAEPDLIKQRKLPPQRTYIFENANVVDTANGTVIPKQTVNLSGGLIQKIGNGGEVPHDAIVVDLTDKYLSPGLIDCHAHLSSVPGEEGLSASIVHPDLAVSYFRQPYMVVQDEVAKGCWPNSDNNRVMTRMACVFEESRRSQP